MEPNECRWRGCHTPPAFTMARSTGPVIASYCEGHIRPAVEDWRIDGPPGVEVVVLRWVAL
jgi:hypothetical protein